MSRHCNWTAIVVTCTTKSYADAIQHQLQLKQSRGFLPNDVTILCIEDPLKRLGSGGATLNALLTLTEHLSSKKGHAVVTSDVLQNCSLLIFHVGRYFPFDPCGRAFVSLPLCPVDGESEDLVTNFDVLYHILTTKLAVDSPPGLWVCSTDMLLNMSENVVLDWKKINVGDGVLAISVPATIEYAVDHGVYHIDKHSKVKDLIFRGSLNDISKCRLTENTVPLASGIVFFSIFATERLLTTHVTPPLDACTYLGIDSGMEPVAISLYFDILLVMASDVSEEEFVKGSRSGAFGKDSALLDKAQRQSMKNVRYVLWKHLRSLQLKATVIESGTHCYLDMQRPPSLYCKTLSINCPSLPGYKFSRRVHSYVHQQARIGDGSVLINSLVECGAVVGYNSVLMHCYITKNTVIGNNCFVYGLDESSSRNLPNQEVPSDSYILGMAVKIKGFQNVKRLYACLNVDDSLLCAVAPSDDPSHNTYWQRDFISQAISCSRMLPASYQNIVSKKYIGKPIPFIHTLFMAKIFPVLHVQYDVDITHCMELLNYSSFSNAECNEWFDFLRLSLCELLENVDHCKEFEFRYSMYAAVACKRLKDILSANLDKSILPLLTLFIFNNNHDLLLNLLDEIAVAAVEDVSVEKRRPDISARALACIADVLGCMAGNKGGLRSGPAANKQWQHPLSQLESGDIQSGISKLAQVRQSWIHHPDMLIRASRHYERAEQILIRHAVMSVASFIKASSCSLLDDNTWYTVECPARIDISGGWTDTPPVCYEYGGSVLNAAILVNGKRPIGARIRKLPQPILVLTLLNSNGSESQRIECTITEQLLNYNQPQSPGALLKACIILAEIVKVNSKMSLQEQLELNFGGGFELQTWANLPQGSGLGTSSILSGAVIDVVFRASGRILDVDSVIHAVLLVEQMLTTGGGWQDQVGGLIGGFKIGRSIPKLPLQVTTECFVLPDYFFDKFSEHLKLIYTGKTRLARNLLQNVLRNWYTKRPFILKNCSDLRDNAEKCAQAFKEQNFEAIGKHINAYWNQKKLMASGCEPDLCKRIMASLMPYALGQSLAGAGGGGFLYVLTREPLSQQFVTSLLHDIDGAQDAVVYDVQLDRVGMTCHMQLV